MAQSFKSDEMNVPQRCLCTSRVGILNVADVNKNIREDPGNLHAIGTAARTDCIPRKKVIAYPVIWCPDQKATFYDERHSL